MSLFDKIVPELGRMDEVALEQLERLFAGQRVWSIHDRFSYVSCKLSILSKLERHREVLTIFREEWPAIVQSGQDVFNCWFAYLRALLATDQTFEAYQELKKNLDRHRGEYQQMAVLQLLVGFNLVIESAPPHIQSLLFHLVDRIGYPNLRKETQRELAKDLCDQFNVSARRLDQLVLNIHETEDLRAKSEMLQEFISKETSPFFRTIAQRYQKHTLG